MIQGKVLVTGATGDTGRATVDELLARGHRVRALAHGQDERSKRLQERAVEVAEQQVERDDLERRDRDAPLGRRGRARMRTRVRKGLRLRHGSPTGNGRARKRKRRPAGRLRVQAAPAYFCGIMPSELVGADIACSMLLVALCMIQTEPETTITRIITVKANATTFQRCSAERSMCRK